MDTAQIKCKISVNKDPHIIVAAVLESYRLLNIDSVKLVIDERSFHSHSEMMIITVTVIVRVFFALIIFVKGEESYFETCINVLVAINYRISIIVKLIIVCLVSLMVSIIDDIKSGIVHFKIIGFLIEVSVIIITVKNKMIYAVYAFLFPEQMIYTLMIYSVINSLVNFLILTFNISRWSKQIIKTMSGISQNRITVFRIILIIRVVVKSRSYNALNSSVSRILRRCIIIACIAVLVRNVFYSFSI